MVAKHTKGARSSKVSPVDGNDGATSPHLRKAFNMIDTTNRGYIDAKDLCVLLKLQEIHVSKDEVKDMIQMYHSPDAAGNVLSFEEFCAVMDNSRDASLRNRKVGCDKAGPDLVEWLNEESQCG